MLFLLTFEGYDKIQLHNLLENKKPPWHSDLGEPLVSLLSFQPSCVTKDDSSRFDKSEHQMQNIKLFSLTEVKSHSQNSTLSKLYRAASMMFSCSVIKCKLKHNFLNWSRKTWFVHGILRKMWQCKKRYGALLLNLLIAFKNRMTLRVGHPETTATDYNYFTWIKVPGYFSNVH